MGRELVAADGFILLQLLLLVLVVELVSNGVVSEAVIGRPDTRLGNCGNVGVSPAGNPGICE